MKRMYIIIRRDMPKTYQAVQAGHALAEFMLKHPDQAKEWGNHTLIYLGTENEETLKQEMNRIKELGYNCECFIEPDIGDQMTAIATYADCEHFHGFRLL